MLLFEFNRGFLGHLTIDLQMGWLKLRKSGATIPTEIQAPINSGNWACIAPELRSHDQKV